jgi:phosphatidylserine/phosphatidylglycerophosphate/cardiolipin synthase-like enzyme
MTQDLVAVARDWADELPRDFARRLAVALRLGPDAVHHLRAEAVLPPSDAAVRMAMDLAVNGDGPFLAGLLVGRLESVIEQPTVTPVWTGPESETVQGRLTLAVLADLIEEARREVLLVSYATMPSEKVRAALSAAAERGVAITTLLERTADNPRFEGHGEPFPGISARRLCWPAADRPVGASMHAKVLVVDRHTALIGSANLTGYGLERNLECGVLIRGGHVPTLLVEHLLSAQGVREAN